MDAQVVSRTYAGVSSEKARLDRFPSGSLAQEISLALGESTERLLLVHYGKQGMRRAFTAGEFAALAESARAYIADQAKGKIPATCAGNSWQHLAFITAALLERGQIALLNPLEPEAARAARLSCLPEPRLFLPDEIERACGEKTVARRPVASCAPLDPAVYVFTSGSTGHAKSVQQTSLGILSNVDSLLTHHEFQPGDVISTPLPIFHVNALEFAFLCALLGKGTLVLHEEFRVPEIYASLEKDKVNILSVIPPILNLFTQIPFPRVKSLRYVVSAASSISHELAQRCFELLPVPVIQGYGLSEAVNFSCLTPIHLSRKDYAALFLAAPRPSIGMAIKGNSVQILREDLSECAPEEAGEVCLRGHNVMLGYWGGTDESVFRGGYLHTGDTGFYRTLPDGTRYFVLLGRKKDVIKVFGHSVGLMDMDDLLLEYFRSDAAISFGLENDISGEEPAIALSPQLLSQEEAGLRELKDFLTQRLPAYAVPKKIFIAGGPLRTASGKPLRWQMAESFRKAETGENYSWAEVRR